MKQELSITREETVLFWIPGKEDSKTAGVLRQNDDGSCELLAISPGWMNKPNSWGWIQDPDNEEILIGCNSTGDRFTLISIKSQRQNLNSNGFPVLTFKFSNLLKGGIFNKMEDIAASDVFVCFDLLSNWIDNQPFLIEEAEDENNTILYVISQKRSDTINLHDSSGVKIYLYPRSGYQFHRNRNVLLQEELFVNIEFSEPKSFYEIKQLAETLRRMISIFACQDAAFSDLYFGNARDKTDVAIHSESGMVRGNGSVIPMFTFMFKEALAECPDFVHRWLELNQSCREIVDYYFSATKSHGEALILDEFIRLIQGLEIYHKVTNDNQHVPVERKMPNVKHSEIMEILRNSGKRQLMEYMEGKGQKALSSFKLEDRLFALLTHYSSMIGEIVNDLDGFAKRLALTRNDFNHRIRDNEPVFNHKELKRAIKILRLLYHAIFLHQMGFSVESVSAALRRHLVFSRLFSEPKMF